MAKYEVRWLSFDAVKLVMCSLVEIGTIQDEHADPARNLYNEIMSAPGAFCLSITQWIDEAAQWISLNPKNL